MSIMVIQPIQGIPTVSNALRRIAGTYLSIMMNSFLLNWLSRTGNSMINKPRKAQGRIWKLRSERNGESRPSQTLEPIERAHHLQVESTSTFETAVSSSWLDREGGGWVQDPT